MKLNKFFMKNITHLLCNANAFKYDINNSNIDNCLVHLISDIKNISVFLINIFI